MDNGYITGYIDVAQITLYVFWAFFFALIFWLRKEDRREGYPLESDPAGIVDQPGWLMPKPKFFRLRNGETVTVPRTGPSGRDVRPVAARRVALWPGAPLVPTGNPLVDGVGPAAWAERADRPDMTWDGQDRLVPSRLAPHVTVAPGDPDPRGLPILGTDGRVGGKVVDIWIDRAEHLVRYIEFEPAGGTGTRLVSMNLAKVTAKDVRVKALMAAQFAAAPSLASPDRITLLEEDRVCAYFAGGHLYATASRAEPLL